MKLRITASRTIIERKTVEVELDDAAADKIMKDDRYTELWAEQHINLDNSPWEPVRQSYPKVDVLVEEIDVNDGAEVPE